MKECPRNCSKRAFIPTKRSCYFYEIFDLYYTPQFSTKLYSIYINNTPGKFLIVYYFMDLFHKMLYFYTLPFASPLLDCSAYSHISSLF